VLVIGSTPAFVTRCREAASRAGAVTWAVDIASVSLRIAQWEPVALVMTEDVFAFDPTKFEALAREHRTWLLTVEDERVAEEELEGRLRAAVQETDRASLRPPSLRPPDARRSERAPADAA
jgi:hypothetical protein